MVVGAALGRENPLTVVLAVILVCGFGYAPTMRSVLASGIAWARAARLALAAGTISITVKKVVNNAVMLATRGAMDVGLNSLLFWSSLAFSQFVEIVETFPVNYWLIRCGCPPQSPLSADPANGRASPSEQYDRSRR